MNRIVLFILLALPVSVRSQDMNAYLEKIRNNAAELTAFFSQMPKGGDLHHHYSGAVYTETYLAYVLEKDFYINPQTLKVTDSLTERDKGFVRFSSLSYDSLYTCKQKLMQKWSVKDYNHVDYPSDKLFFETFPNFGIASNAQYDKGLLEIKRRAKKENVSYIETMFESIPSNISSQELGHYNTSLEQSQARHDATLTSKIFDSLYKAFKLKNIDPDVNAFNAFVKNLHVGLGIDDSSFTMRYQNYALRIFEPVEVFKSLLLSFESANKSPLIVGVNIVAPEDNEISMRDYWLHMQMFNFFHGKYPAVKYALHAGELSLGMVKPEELSWHINAAVYDAHALRIGHGVDMAYETNCYTLLNFMKKNDIAIEINLYSNEFILKVKDDRHPLPLYKKFGVPIVIASDDAGVLRTNLTDQFVLLAMRYSNISYTDIKAFVYNSIKYSFIEEKEVKEKLAKDLDIRFQLFEEKIMNTPELKN